LSFSAAPPPPGRSAGKPRLIFNRRPRPRAAWSSPSAASCVRSRSKRARGSQRIDAPPPQDHQGSLSIDAGMPPCVFLDPTRSYSDRQGSQPSIWRLQAADPDRRCTTRNKLLRRRW
jgi:hypothetical protein